jgi:phosphoserine aminotransferase
VAFILRDDFLIRDPGTRLSIYNAVTEEQVDAVVAYMWDFFGQLQVRSLM